MAWFRQVVACGVVFMVIWYHVQSFLVPVPDDRNTHLEYQLNCSDVATDPASFFCRYTVIGPLMLSFKQVICNGSFEPFPEGHPIINIYYPENEGTEPGRCIFNGPNIVTKNNIQLREYTAFLSMLWSDGYPGWFKLKCYLPLDGSNNGGGGGGGSEPEDGNGGDGGSEPEDGGGGGGSEPENDDGGDGGNGGGGGGSEPEDGDGGGSEPDDGNGGDGGSEPEDGGGGGGSEPENDDGGDGGNGGDGGGSEPEDGDGGGSKPEDGNGGDGESEPEDGDDGDGGNGGDGGGSEPDDGNGGDGGGSEPEDGGGGGGSEPENDDGGDGGNGGDGGGSKPEDGNGGDGESEPEDGDDGDGGNGGDGGGSEPEDDDGVDGGGSEPEDGDGGGSEPEDGDGGGSEPEDGDGGGSEPEDGDGGGSEPEDDDGGDGGGSEPEDDDGGDGGGSEPEDGDGGDGGGSEPEDGDGGGSEPEDDDGGDGGGSEPEDDDGGDGGGSEPEDGDGGGSEPEDGGDGGGSEPEDGDGGDGGGSEPEDGNGGDGGGSEPEDGNGGDGGGSEPEDGDGGGSEPEGSNDDPAVQDDGTSGRSPVIEFEPGCDGVERDVEHGNVFMSQMHVKTDLHMSVVAYCYNGSMVEFQTEDTVNYYLKVYFEIEHYYEGECVFAKSAGETFNIRVETSWGERGDQIHTFTKNVQISCIFNEEGNNTRQDTALVGRSMVTDGFINYKGVEGLSDAVSVISLTVVNVLGQPLGVQEIDLGRTIKLKAVSDGGNGELGISPLTCDVIGVRTNQRYQILRAGCGDGIVIPKDKGFVSEGCVSISPHFTTFTLSGDTLVRFQCNFTMCPEKCDGSTCHVRSRRSVIPAVSEDFLLDSGDL